MAPGPVWTGADNVMLTLGFDPQIIRPVEGHYTHIMKAQRRSRGIALL